MSLLTKSRAKNGEAQPPAPVKQTKKSVKKSSSAQGVMPALPQVNLLPTEIIEKRSLRELKIKLGLYLLVLVGVIVAGFAYVQVEQSLAQSRLTDAQAETTRLKAEEATYAEIPIILGQLDDAQTALRDGMYREILWNDYLGAIAATIPDDGLIESVVVTAATPNAAGPGTTDGLQSNAIGALEFTVNLVEFPDTATWLDDLEAIPGVADARLSAATYSTPINAEPTYEVTGSVRLTEDAYSGRFEPTDAEAGE